MSEPWVEGTALSARLVIVGGGLAGASLALALERAGLDPVLLEPKPPVLDATHHENPRTVALSPASIRFLEKVGAWPGSASAVEGACSYRAMEVWDADGTGRIRFEADELAVSSLGTIVPTSTMLARLWRRLEARGVECVTGSDVIGLARAASCVRLTLENGRTLEAALVVAADGSRSRIREFAGIQARVHPMGQLAITCSAQVEASHEDTAWQRFLDTGPLAVLPLPDDAEGRHWVSVVWSLDENVAGPLCQLDDGTFAGRLTHAFESRLGRILAVGPRVSFPLIQLHAERYLGERVVLVGDAAHVVHPLAGQGGNLGLRDVQVLAEVLADIARGPAAAHLGDMRLLSRYERARRGDNALALTVMAGLKHLFGADDLGLRLLRNLGLSWVDRLGPLKRACAEHALG